MFTSSLPVFTSPMAHPLKEDCPPCMVMFSKDGCRFCDECKPAFDEVQGGYVVNMSKPCMADCAEPSCSSRGFHTGAELIDNFKLASGVMPRTVPAFALYKGGKFVRTYTGQRTTESFQQYVDDLSVVDTRLSETIQSIFPVRSRELYDMYLKARDCFWIEKEIDFSKDYDDWVKLNDGERFFIEHILAFFAMSDQIVNTNLGERFSKDIDTLPDSMRTYVRLFYNLQLAMEDIHSQTYETMLDILVKDKTRHALLKNAITTVPAIKKKAIWATKWIDSTDSVECSFGKRLIAFAVMEGIFFSGSFCAIFWIRERNILKGLTKSNEFIARDEGLHYMFAVKLFNQLKADPTYADQLKCSPEDILEIVRSAVEIESEFITASFPCRMVGMNSDSMQDYIQFVADKLLVLLGLQPHWKTNNPFQFMDNIGMDTKANFFEERVTQYRKANSAATCIEDNHLDEDF